MPRSSRDVQASLLRQKLRQLDEERTSCVARLLDARDLFAASLSVVYRSCGKPSCACTRGSPHGPYYFLSIQSHGRNERYHVPRVTADRMGLGIAKYRAFAADLRRLRSLDRQIEALAGRLQRRCETLSMRSFKTS